MTQRDLFIYGLVILAVVLFAVRMWLVNHPGADEVQPPIVQALPAENLDEGDERTIQLPANDAAWKPIGRGPLIITATGKVDLGGIQTTPNDEKRPGDAKTLVPSLPYGMLVGRIGENGKPFRIGARAQVAQRDVLYLNINDSDYADNSGSYTVTLKRGYRKSDDDPW
jgi:hypothetical protein